MKQSTSNFVPSIASSEPIYLSGLADRLDMVIDLLARANELLERSLLQEPTSRRSTRRARVAGGAKTARKRRGPDAGTRSPRLHEEIAAILRDAKRPLSANEIAAEVRTRGLFTGRTQTDSVTASHVSSRVSHPLYRDRFL